MKLIPVLFFLLTGKALACWQVQALVKAGKEQISINQKMNHDQTYSFAFVPYYLHLKMASSNKDHRPIEWSLQERSGNKLTELTKNHSPLKLNEITTFKSSELIESHPATLRMIIKEI